MGQQCTSSSSIIPEELIQKIPKIIFTRYLYVKDEVKLTLLICILNKNEKSLFWAYELYHSGFENELFDFLWKIYFDFYYTLNPSFYDYFVKRHKEWKKIAIGIQKDKIINIIVNNLMIRPSNIDVFLLRQIVNYSDFKLHDITGMHIMLEGLEFINFKKLTEWFNNKEYINISNFVLNVCKEKHIDELLMFVNSYFKKQSNNDKKILEYKMHMHNISVQQRHTILAYIIMQFTILEEDIRMGKKLYVRVDEEETKIHETIQSDHNACFYPYKILPKACVNSIDENNYLSLFKLQRDSIDLQNAYFNHWEYYAAYSPIWFERIKKYKGIINHSTRKVDFPTDELLEAFYDEYNYETDEQTLDTQLKSIQEIVTTRTWKQFYETRKQSGIFNPNIELFDLFVKLEY
jgi:hypothetical protein